MIDCGLSRDVLFHSLVECRTAGKAWKDVLLLLLSSKELVGGGEVVSCFFLRVIPASCYSGIKTF